MNITKQTYVYISPNSLGIKYKKKKINKFLRLLVEIKSFSTLQQHTICIR